MTALAERLLRRYFPKVTPLAVKLIARHEADSDKADTAARIPASATPELDLAELRHHEPKTPAPALWDHAREYAARYGLEAK